MVVRCPLRGNSILGEILDLSRVSGTCFKTETPKNLVSIFCQNTVFANLGKCGFVHCLEIF